MRRLSPSVRAASLPHREARLSSEELLSMTMTSYETEGGAATRLSTQRRRSSPPFQLTMMTDSSALMSRSGHVTINARGRFNAAARVVTFGLRSDVMDGNSHRSAVGVL